MATTKVTIKEIDNNKHIPLFFSLQVGDYFKTNNSPVICIKIGSNYNSSNYIKLNTVAEKTGIMNSNAEVIPISEIEINYKV